MSDYDFEGRDVEDSLDYRLGLILGQFAAVCVVAGVVFLAVGFAVVSLRWLLSVALHATG